MIMVVVMVDVLVNVLATGTRGGVLGELPLQPADDLHHRSGLVLLSGRVLQLMLLARLAALLRLTELRLVALNIVIARRSLIYRAVGRDVAGVAARVNRGLLLRVDSGADHGAGQDLRLNVGPRRRHRRRVVPLETVLRPRLPKIPPRLGRYFREGRERLSLLPGRFVVRHRRGPRFRG